MCCESCENWKFVSFFFGAWNIISGLLLASYSTIYLIRTDVAVEGHIETMRVLHWAVVITALIHIPSGALILMGLWLDKKFIFLAGLILSNIMPLVAFLTIIVPVVHIICLVKAIRYYRWNWE